MLNTIGGSFTIGLAVGLLLALFVRKVRTIVLLLLAVPFSMIAYISWWQYRHPENLTSTSGVDLIFGPLWPSFGAIAGYWCTRIVMNALKK